MIRPKFYIIFTDLCCAFISLLLAYLIRFASLSSMLDAFSNSYSKLISYLVVTVFAAYFFELYDQRRFDNRRFLAYRIMAAAILSFFILSASYYLIPIVQIGRGLLVIALLVLAVFQFALRRVIYKFSSRAQFATRILIIGAGELAQDIADIVPRDNNIHSFVRFVSCTEREPIVNPEHIVGPIENIDDLVRDYKPQKLIIALKERRGNLPLREFMHSKLKGVEVLDAITFYEQVKHCLMIENMKPSAFVYSQGFKMTSFMRSYKRVYDVLFSTVGLMIAFPMFPILALLIKIDSQGPIFYKQLRVGEREVEFFVYKFRTMAQDAEKESGVVWAQKHDPRVTRIGKLMRKTRLDEIPQLYNVLKGDMSFIGPRPERMTFVERLKETIPFYSTRHFVKPGVTGWAQVCYPYGASDEDALEKLRYDLYYIKNYSVFLDLKIIIDTIRVVISGFGGR